MGTAISRPTSSSESSGCSSICLCNETPDLRECRLDSPAATGGQSSAIAAETRQMDLDDDGKDAFAGVQQLDLENLRLEASNVHPSVFDYVAMQTHLRSLTIRNIENDAQVDLTFLMNIPYLETLVMDNCDGLMTGGLDVLLALSSLRHLVLGIETLNHLTSEFCVGCSADVSLILYGQRRLDDPQKIRAFKNLVSLKYTDFLTMDYPLWVKEMGKLQSLSFLNGRIRETHEDYTVFFPTSLTRFSSQACKMDRRIVDAIFYSGDLLQELELGFLCLTADIPIRFCSDLRILKISAEECDAEAFKQLSLNKHLSSIDLSGCLKMGADDLSALESLKNLQRVVISNCFLGQGCCRLLASLRSLQSLEFYATWGVDLIELATKVNNLRRLSLVKCIDLSAGLDDFIISDLMKRLDSLEIEF